MIDIVWWVIVVALPFAALLLAMLAAGMFTANLPLFQSLDSPPLGDESSDPPRVSVLIPARDEAASIEACVNSITSNVQVELEVVVLDDGSSDGTGDLVRAMAERDGRVRLIEGIDLPDGWNGKQHACYRLAQHANYERLLFLDADVRLEPTAILDLCRRAAVRHEGRSIGLLSAFPNQETGTIAEKMLIPMMHFILLSYLPFMRMRGSTNPAYASGCGQLFFTTQEAYRAAGTHEAIRTSRHDGLKLPKAYRANGMLTDCVDGTSIARCRMYTTTAEVVRGLLKNASEGIANSRLLIPFTILLGGANVLPWVTLAAGLWRRSQWVAAGSPVGVGLVIGILVSVMAIVISYWPRVAAAIRLRQSVAGAALHPLAIAVFLVLQWWAFANHLRGRQVTWRGRI